MPTPSIALTRLQIQNFRGIESLDLDFVGPDGKPNQLVVLAGPNGSGKTAVLEAALLAAGDSNLITGPSGRRAIRRGSDRYVIRAAFQINGKETESLVESPSPQTTRMLEDLPLWYFSSWRASALVGPVNRTVGRPGRKPAKNDQNRLLNVKHLLVTAAAIERFDNSFPNSVITLKQSERSTKHGAILSQS